MDLPPKKGVVSLWLQTETEVSLIKSRTKCCPTQEAKNRVHPALTPKSRPHPLGRRCPVGTGRVGGARWGPSAPTPTAAMTCGPMARHLARAPTAANERVENERMSRQRSESGIQLHSCSRSPPVKSHVKFWQNDLDLLRSFNEQGAQLVGRGGSLQPGFARQKH